MALAVFSADSPNRSQKNDIREDVKVFGGVTAYKQLLFIRDTIGLGWVIQKHPLLANCKKALNFVMLVSSEVSLIMVPVCTVLIAT